MFRLAVITLGLSGLSVVVVLLIGQRFPVEIATEFMYDNEYVYALLIRDLEHSIALPLAGTRCFPALPFTSEWSALRQRYQLNELQRFTIYDTRPETAMARLSCLGLGESSLENRR